MNVKEFLMARLDEDEAAARDDPDWDGNHDPARALRDVAAKRVIAESYTLDFGDDGAPGAFCGGYGEAYWDVMCTLAAIYGDHPDYRPEWKVAP